MTNNNVTALQYLWTAVCTTDVDKIEGKGRGGKHLLPPEVSSVDLFSSVPDLD